MTDVIPAKNLLDACFVEDSFKFKCSLCDEKFTTSQNLIKHSTKFHNGKGHERQKRLLSKRKYGQM